MHRRNFITTLLGALVVSGIKVRNAGAWTFITEDEFKEESGGALPKAVPAPPSQSGAPVIEVLEPDPAKPIKSPVTIRIRFHAQAGARIIPTSFRAKYGWFDITDRLVAHAKVDATGIFAENAEIPAGQYKVTLQIADDQGRSATRALEFRVV